jgi:hypothetical protein
VSERVSLEDRAQEYAARCNPPQQHEATEQVLLAARKYAYIYGYRAAIEDAAALLDERQRSEEENAESGRTWGSRRMSEYGAMTCRHCAAAIRSLEDGR